LFISYVYNDLIIITIITGLNTSAIYAFFTYVWYHISRWWHCNVIKLIYKIKLYLLKVKWNILEKKRE